MLTLDATEGIKALVIAILDNLVEDDSQDSSDPTTIDESSERSSDEHDVSLKSRRMLIKYTMYRYLFFK